MAASQTNKNKMLESDTRAHPGAIRTGELLRWSVSREKTSGAAVGAPGGMLLSQGTRGLLYGPWAARGRWCGQREVPLGRLIQIVVWSVACITQGSAGAGR